MNIREFLQIIRHRLLNPLEITLLFVSFIISILLLQILSQVDVINEIYCIFHTYFPIPDSILKLLFWFVLFHLTKRLVVFVVEYAKRGSNYSFKSKNWREEWIFNGQSYVLSKPDRLIIRSSRAGCLLKKHVWKNFELKFEMKFLENVALKHIGILFRAKDLENYFMLEVFQNGNNGTIFVKPHVRVQGAWEFVQETPIGKFDFKDFREIKLHIDRFKVVLSIAGKNVFEWDLPTHVDINHIESGISGLSDETTSRGIIPKIDFREIYGMVGFRAYPGQGAEIKNIKIEGF